MLLPSLQDLQTGNHHRQSSCQGLNGTVNWAFLWSYCFNSHMAPVRGPIVTDYCPACLDRTWSHGSKLSRSRLACGRKTHCRLRPPIMLWNQEDESTISEMISVDAFYCCLRKRRQTQPRPACALTALLKPACCFYPVMCGTASASTCLQNVKEFSQ